MNNYLILTNNTNMIYLIIFGILGILLFVLVMPIKVRIIRNNNQNDIDVYLLWLLSKHIDIDDAIRYILATKEDRTKITRKSALYNLGLFFKSYNIFIDLFKRIRIIKSTIIWNSSVPVHEFTVFSNIFAWNLISTIRNFLTTNFKSIKNEYYSVNTLNLQSSYEVDFELIFVLRPIHLLLAIIKNYKDISKIKKYKEEQNVRASNI